jgi:hypothetical protein
MIFSRMEAKITTLPSIKHRYSSHEDRSPVSCFLPTAQALSNIIFPFFSLTRAETDDSISFLAEISFLSRLSPFRAVISRFSLLTRCCSARFSGFSPYMAPMDT